MEYKQKFFYVAIVNVNGLPDEGGATLGHIWTCAHASAYYISNSNVLITEKNYQFALIKVFEFCTSERRYCTVFL